jgi:hypothetical protein
MVLGWMPAARGVISSTALGPHVPTCYLGCWCGAFAGQTWSNPVMAQSSIISADQIGDLGRQLYGEHWQAPLARALGINLRVLRYWLSGKGVPSPAQTQRLLALIEHAAEETARQARRFAAAAGRVPSARRWTFEPEDLEIIDRKIVRHRETGSEISFYDYVTPPLPSDVPGGTIYKMGDFSSADLQRFQVAAWAKLAAWRYGRRAE